MSKKTVLVVDDAPGNLDLLVGLLSEKYIVKAAINGELALKIAQCPKPPDLILLDIVMPGMDGLEVCRVLKENPATMDIPVVFLSGKANDADCEQRIDIDGAAYLQKPVDPDRLFSVLEIILP